MRVIHGSTDFYHNMLDVDVRKKVMPIHELYIRNVLRHFDEITSINSCLCGDIKLPEEHDERQIAMILHEILADHCPLTQCKKCKVLLRQEIRQYHESYDCDDEKGSERHIQQIYINDKKRVEEIKRLNA